MSSKPSYIQRGIGAIRHLCRYVWRHTIVAVFQPIVRSFVVNRLSRKIVNFVYRRLSWSQKRRFHKNFARIFRDHDFGDAGGNWTVEFVGRRIRMPLRPEQIWLDWDSAVSICGHDVEVKETYANLIGSNVQPRLFVDVGANYGTHSLLFLVHEIRTLSFEPNVACRENIELICNENGVAPLIENVALGESEGVVELVYPATDTWLGSTNPVAKRRFNAEENISRIEVKQKTIDDYYDDYPENFFLIKIDTEGNELEVLKGARRTLAEKRPFVILECWKDAQFRKELYLFYTDFKYEIFRLPWAPETPGLPLAEADFLEAEALNFIAVPVKDCGN